MCLCVGGTTALQDAHGVTELELWERRPHFQGFKTAGGGDKSVNLLD